MMLIIVELLIMLCILLFVPGDYAVPCFLGFAIGRFGRCCAANCWWYLHQESRHAATSSSSAQT